MISTNGSDSFACQRPQHATLIGSAVDRWGRQPLQQRMRGIDAIGDRRWFDVHVALVLYNGSSSRDITKLLPTLVGSREEKSSPVAGVMTVVIDFGMLDCRRSESTVHECID